MNRGDIAGPIGVALFIVLLALALRHERSTQRPLAALLPRILAVLFLSLALLGQRFQFSWKTKPGLDLLILVDESPSMSIEDRTEQASSILTQMTRSQIGRVGIWGFSDTVVKLGAGLRLRTDLRALARNTPGTDIGLALRTAQVARPGAAILISDGAHNVGPDPVRVASRLDFPVYTVGVGKRMNQDLALDRMRGPVEAYEGDTLSLTVRYRALGFQDNRTRLRLLEDDRLVLARELVIHDSEEVQELELRVPTTGKGRHHYQAVIDSLPQETVLSNNSSMIAVEVLPRRIRIVYLTSHPSYSTRVLLGSLHANPDFQVLPLVTLTGRRIQRVTAQGLQDWSPQNGIDAEVLILDNADETELGLSSALGRFAQDHGLLVLAGEAFRPGPALSLVLPLVSKGEHTRQPIVATVAEDAWDTPFLLDLARGLFAEAPPFLGAVRTESVRADAKVWAKSTDGIPLLAYRRNGRGKVVQIAGYPFWRAGFSERTQAATSFNSLLGGLVRFLAMDEKDRFRLSTDKRAYHAGEPITAVLRATSDDFRPWQGLNVLLSVQADTLPSGHVAANQYQTPSETKQGTRTKVVRTMTELSPGTYEAELERLGPGNYLILADIGLSDRELGKASTSFTILESNLELSQSALDESLLRRIALATGGSYSHAESLGSRLPEIRPAHYQRTFAFDPRSNPLFLVLTSLLFLTDIYLRRKQGLA
ncbi:MAG: vWA domain-containing protein [candidate division WOR-3 bacterium]